jgi:hypothetical protein
LIGLIWSLADWYGVVGAALAWLAAVGSSQFLSAIFLKQLLPKPLAGLAGPLLVITTVSLIGGLFALGVEQALPGLAGLAAAALLATAMIGLLLWLADRRFDLGLSDNVIRLFPQVASLRRLRVADLS